MEVKGEEGHRNRDLNIQRGWGKAESSPHKNLSLLRRLSCSFVVRVEYLSMMPPEATRGLLVTDLEVRIECFVTMHPSESIETQLVPWAQKISLDTSASEFRARKCASAADQVLPCPGALMDKPAQVTPELTPPNFHTMPT
ncbi:hypothetical protein TNCV_102941 [Trichonephila clavipes]|nr:hypothetical protein TNCV_102941 [Trichonephila clavipes]